MLDHYLREVGLLAQEKAVHRMSGLPAVRFGIRGRGRVEVGAFADLVAFDPRGIRDRASFEQPAQSAAGIEQVLVNGVPSWRAGEPSGVRAGRVPGGGDG